MFVGPPDELIRIATRMGAGGVGFERPALEVDFLKNSLIFRKKTNEIGPQGRRRGGSCAPTLELAQGPTLELGPVRSRDVTTRAEFGSCHGFIVFSIENQ